MSSPIDWEQICARCNHARRDHNDAGTECAVCRGACAFAAALFRLVGKFVGGGWWQSNDTFESAQAALDWYASETWTTRSTHLRAEPVQAEGDAR